MFNAIVVHDDQYGTIWRRPDGHLVATAKDTRPVPEGVEKFKAWLDRA